MRADPQRAKNTVKPFCALLESAFVKAVLKILVKSTPDVNFWHKVQMRLQ